MPDIRLPDGAIRSFPAAVTVGEIAQSIGAGLARAALAGRVDGKISARPRFRPAPAMTRLEPSAPSTVPERGESAAAR